MQKARRHPTRGSDRLRAHGFRFSFTPLSAVLFTFPSRYLCAIGLPGVLSLGGWCRRIRTGLLRPRPTQGTGPVGHACAYGAVTRYGAPFQASSATVASSALPALLPRARLDARGLGCPPFARRYSGGHCCFPFLRLLGCFGSSGSPPLQGDAAPPRGGLPHSGTHGSRAVRASPWTFAACRALHRLREPRHPPCALTRFSLSLSAAAHRCAAASLVCRFLSVSAFTFPSCQRTARAPWCPLSWRMWGSNPRPPACKAGALAS